MSQITEADKRFSKTLLTVYTVVLTLFAVFGFIFVNADTAGGATLSKRLPFLLYIVLSWLYWWTYHYIIKKNLKRVYLQLIWASPIILLLIGYFISGSK